MDLGVGNPKSATPMKNSNGFQSKFSENSNPNVFSRSSPLNKSAKSQKSASSKKGQVIGQNPVAFSPRNKLRERKFVVIKKNSKKQNVNPSNAVDCKCKERNGGKKCLCVAYKSLRASQDDFFKVKNEEVEEEKEGFDEEKEEERAFEARGGVEEGEEEMIEKGFGSEQEISGEIERLGGNARIKRRRAKLLEEARNSVPEFGRVMHLVKAFEDLMKIPSLKDSDKNDEKEEDEEEKEEEAKESRKKAMQWALPGLQTSKVHATQEASVSSAFSLPEFQSPELSEAQVSSSSSSFCPSDMFLTPENLGLDSRFSVSSSGDSSQGSVSRRTSNGGRSHRNSSESMGIKGGKTWKKNKQLKPTSQMPFRLRTQQRGRMKEEEFTKKIQEMVTEEERMRIPIAQGLPWTTDEPECLIKPPVKDVTRPFDLKLHSDVRAAERAEFDHQVAEKLSLIEQYKTERDRQQKLAEDEQVRRLRKELIPKAQPLPYFDRPFIPRRSSKHPTVPKEPKFRMPQHKKIRCLPLDNISSTFTNQE